MTEIIASIPGWLLPWLLFALSVIAFALILERASILFFRPGPLTTQMEEHFLQLLGQNREDALNFARSQAHPAFGAAATLLESPTDDPGAADLAAERATRKFQRFLTSLGVISTIAPLLGLLGTVTGMIKSFRALEKSGAQNVALMGGIDEALITTALGLIIAIPSLVAYNYYAARANDLMDRTAAICRRCLIKRTP